MGLETAIIIGMAASTAVSVGATLQQRQAVKAKAKDDARVARRNAVQDQGDLSVNKDIEAANRQEAVMDVASQRRFMMRKFRKESASITAQMTRQGVDPNSVSLDNILKDKMLNDEMDLQVMRTQTSRKTAASRSVSRNMTRDIFSVGQMGEYNAKTAEEGGRQQGRALSLSALGQGLSGMAAIGARKADTRAKAEK